MNIINFTKEKVAEAGSQTAVARKTGVSQGTITKICNGDTTPELGTIYKIAAAYGIPLSYFVSDKPEPYGCNTDTPDQRVIRRFPVISQVSAGAGTGFCWGCKAIDYIDGPVDLNDQDAFAMKVKGDSMAPKYTEGMYVYATTSSRESIVNGDYVVVKLHNSELLLKRYRRTNGTIILESINQSYDPILVTEQDIIDIAKVTHSKER